MAIIVVGGSNRGVGKTSLVCALIAALPEYRWVAVKITTHNHKQMASTSQSAAHDEQSSDRRAKLHGQSSDEMSAVSTREEQLESAAPGSLIWEETEPGFTNDTGRYLYAGASRAMLVFAPASELSDPLNELWPRFGRGTNFIFESNSVVHHVSPDLCLLIHGVAEKSMYLPERKPSFIAAVRHADAMVAQGRVDRVVPDGLSVAAQDPESDLPPESRPVFQLADLNRISPEMLAWVRLRIDPTLRF
jgi:hypothetical protein